MPWTRYKIKHILESFYCFQALLNIKPCYIRNDKRQAYKALCTFDVILVCILWSPSPSPTQAQDLWSEKKKKPQQEQTLSAKSTSPVKIPIFMYNFYFFIFFYLCIQSKWPYATFFCITNKWKLIWAVQTCYALNL